jgi:hypothetical protein
MWWHRPNPKPTLAACGLALTLLLAGCETFPTADSAEEQQQAAAEEANRAITAEARVAGSTNDSHAISDLIGGSLGAGGGFLVGIPAQNTKPADPAKFRNDAIAASRRAERDPAKAEVVDTTDAADLNGDGFITVDEVVAMRQAHLSDREVLDRLRHTDATFQITAFQETYLRDRGVGATVIQGMREMSRVDPDDNARLASDKQAAPTIQQSKENSSTGEHF